ncbi:MAG: hypothetical protein FWD15_05015 [Alphaproteobacteria bacterium]|nr:hypothetical protein [Alphaproteobacteria bacterium]
MKMKNFAALALAVVLAGCSSTSDSLFGGSGSRKGSADGAFGQTFVKNKIENFKSEQAQLRGVISGRQDQLAKMRQDTNAAVAEYRTTVAQISAKLSQGTTPGNPELMDQWRIARSRLENVSEIAFDLKRLVADIESDASMVDYMVGSIRASFAIRGATEDEHKQLAALEEEAKSIGVEIESFARNVDREAERQIAYVEGERANLNDLALNIRNGRLFGSGSTRDFFAGGGSMFSSDEAFKSFREEAARDFAPQAAPSRPVFTREAPVFNQAAAAPAASGARLGSELAPSARGVSSDLRPIVVLRFDRADMMFEEPLFQAASRSLERNPAATFEVVGVTPRGKSSADTQKYVRGVVKALSDMGMPASRIALSSIVGDVAVHEVRVIER